MPDATPLPPAPPPGCQSSGPKEVACGDAIDDDCDGKVDCADEDCEAASCGGGPLVCMGGGCTLPGVLKPLPPLTNVTTEVRGDSVLVQFFADKGAADYRIYAFPDPANITQNADGSVTVKNAIYRCSGARPLPTFDGVTDGDTLFYNRKATEAMLGYVFPSPAPGRIPVFSLGLPTPNSDSRTGTPFKASRVTHLTSDVAKRAELLMQGYRDDGIAFYLPPSGGDKKLYGLRSPPQAFSQNKIYNLFYTDGPERTQRLKDQGPETTIGTIMSAPSGGALPLYRVTWNNADIHDILAVGDANRDRALKQGNVPLNELVWSGMSGKTTLVVEALDRGCPFTSLLAAEDVPAAGYAKPYVSIETTRAASPTGEVWVNAQYPDTGAPIPVARSFVTVEPTPPPQMDFFADFLTTGVGQTYKVVDSNNNVGDVHLSSALFDVDFNSLEMPVRTIKEALGQLWVGLADRAADVNGKVRIAPNMMATLADANYLHVVAEMDIGGTRRRYPQILVSNLKPPIQRAMASGTTIIVQSFGSAVQEIQLQVCKNRVWDVNAQCPEVWLTGGRDMKSGAYRDETSPWRPQFVPGEYAGFDRLVHFDVYLSTTRVYVFMENKPFGCGVLPASTWAAGPVSVNLGNVLYHSGVDEEVVCANCPQKYLKRYSLTQSLRKFDNFGFKNGASLPTWDEAVLPCMTGPWEVH